MPGGSSAAKQGKEADTKIKKAMGNRAKDSGGSDVSDSSGFEFSFNNPKDNNGIPDAMDAEKADDFKGVKFKDVDINKNTANNIFKMITTHFKTPIVLIEEMR